MNLMPTMSQPVERIAPGAAAPRTEASITWLLFPCESGVEASIPIPPIYFPFDSGVEASMPIPPLWFPFDAN